MELCCRLSPVMIFPEFISKIDFRTLSFATHNVMHDGTHLLIFVLIPRYIITRYYQQTVFTQTLYLCMFLCFVSLLIQKLRLLLIWILIFGATIRFQRCWLLIEKWKHLQLKLILFSIFK